MASRPTVTAAAAAAARSIFVTHDAKPDQLRTTRFVAWGPRAGQRENKKKNNNKNE